MANFYGLDAMAGHLTKDGSAKPEATGRKNLSLEGLRGVAALGVVVAHFLFAILPSINAYGYPGGTFEPRLSFESWAALPFSTVFFNGGFQVSLFFALSGFVLTQKIVQSGDASGVSAGVLRRYPRLIFPAAVSVLFAWCLLELGMMHTDLSPFIGGSGWVVGAYATPVSFLEAAFQGFVSAPLYGVASLNDPLWTIRVEFIGSLLLFLSYSFFGKSRPFLVALLFCIFAAAITGPSLYIIYYMTLLVGSFMNYAVARRRMAPAWTAGLAILGMLLGAADYSPAFLAYQGVLSGIGFSTYAAKAFTQAIGACLVVFALVMSPASMAAGVLGNRFFAWLGRISFSVYLVHWPIVCSIGFMVVFVAEKYLGWTFGHALALSAFCVLSAVLVVAELFTRFVDAPSMKLGIAFSDAILRRVSKIKVIPQVGHLAAACACIGGLFLLSPWTSRIAAYTDAIVPAHFSRIEPLAGVCGAAIQRPVRIAMYGDNTQLGESVVDGRRMIVRANVPALLSARFCEVFGGSVVVENHGVSGITTQDLVAGHNGVSRDWKSEMGASDADIVVINTGANDVSAANPNFGAIYEDWLSIIRTAQGLGKVVVVEAANPVDTPHNVDLWSVVHAQQGAADVSHAIFVDQYALVSKVPGWNRLLADKVNPTEKLYRFKASILSDALFPTVKKMVTERSQVHAN